ncbi:GntR family transcriptional regulator [Curtobacterium sp. 9128]|uniref:GntR family transcriptional regulator n=1 Tax=Curtobacterium sp. 9128 TaxID=1793722 RepID=UPI001C92D892|nr:GntR family transcriptional regulator [Curtobacterium sp. 9128]
MTSTGLVAIDAGGRIPPYEQVRAQIAAQIAAGYLVDGQRLPSVRALAEELRLAAGTVAKAYTLLEEAGLVHTARGAGTRVVRPADVPEDVVGAARRGRSLRWRGLPGCRRTRLWGRSATSGRRRSGGSSHGARFAAGRVSHGARFAAGRHPHGARFAAGRPRTVRGSRPGGLARCAVRERAALARCAVRGPCASDVPVRRNRHAPCG